MVKENEMEKKAFKNHSIFCGWTQYFDENGIEWRRENNGIYKFFKNIDDNFVHQGNLNSLSRGIKKLHQEFVEKEAV